MHTAGIIVLSSLSAAAILAVFTALLYAAILDGRDETAFRARGH